LYDDQAVAYTYMHTNMHMYLYKTQ